MLLKVSRFCCCRKAAGLCPGPPSSFEASLGDYVCALKLPAQAAKHTRDIIAAHDFSSARAHLVPSIPGYHTGPAAAVALQPDQLACSQKSGPA